MSRYIGDKSTDAEIILDIEKGIIKMDYALNKFQIDSLDSNGSIFSFQGIEEYNKKFDKVRDNFWQRQKNIIFLYKRIAFYFLMRIPSIRKKIQYKYQQFQEDFNKNLSGIVEYNFSGSLNSPEFLYHLNNNLWFEYELSGDYKLFIKTISLKRRMIKNIYKGEIFDAQDGWDLIFSFSKTPKQGTCLIRYLNY